MSGIFHSIKKASPKVQVELDYLVRFFDWDGTLLKEQWIEDGSDSATAPTPPEHENLTFFGWNKDYTTTDKNMDVGAIYTAAHTYIYINVNAASANIISLKVTKTSSALMTVHWGDGTSSTSTVNSNIEFQKNYGDFGNYIIRIETSDNFYLGQGGQTTSILGTLNSCITKVLLSDKSLLANYSFYNARALKYLSFGKVLTTIPMYCFSGCALLHATLPDTVTRILMGGFTGNYALKSVVLPETIVTISNSAFYFTLNLESIIFTWKVNVAAQTVLGQSMVKKVEFQGQVSSIQIGSFTSCNGIKSIRFNGYLSYISNEAFGYMSAIEEFIFESTTPPTLVAGAFTIESNMFLVKIYVPDASVASYKSATNWNTLANYIYPISSRP